MTTFNFDNINYENKLATPLGSILSLIKEFIPQFSSIAVNATVDTLVIEFDYTKYEEFLHNNNSIFLSKTGSFRKARKVEVQSTSTSWFAFSVEVNQHNNTSEVVTTTSTWCTQPKEFIFLCSIDNT